MLQILGIVLQILVIKLNKINFAFKRERYYIKIEKLLQIIRKVVSCNHKKWELLLKYNMHEKKYITINFKLNFMKHVLTLQLRHLQVIMVFSMRKK